MVRVETGARLHAGFANLSLERERLYGALGVALAAPRTVVSAEPADEVRCESPLAREYAAAAVDELGVSGAAVTVESSLPRHVGLGSGTQLALSTLTAVARAHGREPRVRERAPALGRGGRSGVGVAAFEGGGIVLDAGHPSARFTTDRPADGDWTVPATVARHPVPESWRFLLVRPAVEAGRHGDGEDAAMRAAVERADPALADRIAGLLVRRVLPAAAEGSVERFGAAVGKLGRLNGAWYADEQGGVYRPPVGAIVDRLSESAAVDGAGQSSWGPTVYGITDADRVDRAREAGRAALSAAGVDGDVRVVAGDDDGATIYP